MKTLPRIAALTIATAITTAALHALADGQLLTNKAGMTVYTFDKDTVGKSNCNDACAKLWPPVAVEAAPASSDISVITRDDGGKQAAFKGAPIYLYAADQKPGDATGDGVKNVWHVISPGKPAKAGSAPASTGYGTGSNYGY